MIVTTVFKTLKIGTQKPERALRAHLKFLKMVSIYYNSTGMRRLGAPKLSCKRKKEN